MIYDLVGLLHHRLAFVQAARLVVLLRLLALILQDHTSVHVVLIHRNALRLVLVPEIVAKDIVVAVAMSILAVLTHFCALHFLVVDLYLFLIADFVVVTVVLVLGVSFHVVGQLGLDQIHLRAELSRLPELRVTLSGGRAAQRLAILILEESRLARALANGHVDLLGVLMIVEGSHILLRVLVPVGLPNLNDGVSLGAEGRVVCVRVLCICGVQGRQLIRVDLRACYPALEVGLLQIACVELDVVGEDAAVSLFDLAHEDLLDAAWIVGLTLRDKALTYLLECVLRVLVPRLQLHSRGDALLTVATHRDAMLPLHLLLLARVKCLIDAVLLLLVLDLQIVLLVRVDLVGA